jgi:hypothetical protein
MIYMHKTEEEVHNDCLEILEKLMEYLKNETYLVTGVRWDAEMKQRPLENEGFIVDMDSRLTGREFVKIDLKKKENINESS